MGALILYIAVIMVVGLVSTIIVGQAWEYTPRPIHWGLLSKALAEHEPTAPTITAPTITAPTITAPTTARYDFAPGFEQYLTTELREMLDAWDSEPEGSSLRKMLAAQIFGRTYPYDDWMEVKGVNVNQGSAVVLCHDTGKYIEAIVSEEFSDKAPREQALEIVRQRRAARELRRPPRGRPRWCL